MGERTVARKAVGDTDNSVVAAPIPGRACDQITRRIPDAYPAKRRSTIDALCPPKPDEFETATPTSASRASFGT